MGRISLSFVTTRPLMAVGSCRVCDTLDRWSVTVARHLVFAHIPRLSVRGFEPLTCQGSDLRKCELASKNGDGRRPFAWLATVEAFSSVAMATLTASPRL